MATPRILQDIASLPPEAQKQVSDFVAFLQSRYLVPTGKKARRIALTQEPFIGMWKDREDMQNSTAWVRQLRRTHWGRKA